MTSWVLGLHLPCLCHPLTRQRFRAEPWWAMGESPGEDAMKRNRTPNAPVALSIFLAMGLLLLVTSGPAVAQVRQEQATLTVVVGNVEVLTGGTTAWRRATIGMRLAQGDEVRAATNAEA